MKAHAMNNAERKLTEMQSLCEQLEHNLQTLQTLNQNLPKIITQMKRLRELYQSDWLEAVDELKTDEVAWERVYQLASEGHYSVLGEDTIWDVLTETDKESKQLLHQLVDLLD